jgi:hypothetical protein
MSSVGKIIVKGKRNGRMNGKNKGRKRKIKASRN